MREEGADDMTDSVDFLTRRLVKFLKICKHKKLPKGPGFKRVIVQSLANVTEPVEDQRSLV